MVPQCSFSACMWKDAGSKSEWSDGMLNSLSPCMLSMLKPLVEYVLMTVLRPFFILDLVLFGPDCVVRKLMDDDLV